MATITGATLPENKIDGVNIFPLLLGNTNVSPRRYFYYYNKNSLEAVQKDYWKLVLPHKYRSYVGVLAGKDGWPGKYANDSAKNIELYNLHVDPGERNAVKSLYPEIVEELQKIVEEARIELGDDNVNRLGTNRREPGKVKH